jgi:hypothetical protein
MTSGTKWVRYPHWAMINSMEPEKRRAWLTSYLDTTADIVAPEFARYVRQRDRWLDDLGYDRRTFVGTWVKVGPFVYELETEP